MEQTEAIEAIKRMRVQLEIGLQEAKLRAAQAQHLGNRGNDDDETDDRARRIRYKAERPKIPAFNGDRDDIDAYLLRYEQVAKANRWPGADWALHLSTCITGKAVEPNARLTPDAWLPMAENRSIAAIPLYGQSVSKTILPLAGRAQRDHDDIPRSQSEVLHAMDRDVAS